MDELEILVCLEIIKDMTDRQIQANTEYIRITAEAAHKRIIHNRDNPKKSSL